MKGKGKAIATKGKNRERDVDKDKEKEREWEREREDREKDKGEATDLKDCPLQFPDFSPIDHAKSCPNYSAILSKSEDDTLNFDDLDPLQLELETLLSSVTKRMRELDCEKKILINWQEKKELKKPNGSKAHSQSMGKRGKSQDDRPHKKFRGETSAGSSGKAGNVGSGPGRPKSKNAKLQEYDFNDSPADAPRVPKNDAPNRFWASVEPYCADITADDIKLLEDLIKNHEEDSEYYKIPGLGKHYSIKWAQEDLLEEQKEGAKVNEKRRGLNNSSNLNATDSEKLLKKAEKECNDDSSPFGALTQRLVACLIEENIMTPMDESITGPPEIAEANVVSVPLNKGGLIKSLNISNASQLERRIKRELEEQGIFEAEDNPQENPDDEILAELRKCQAELKALTSYNLQTKRRLLKLAKEEMVKQELRRKLQAADAEVMDAYRRITAARQKKKTPTKKEKEQAYKALREREGIIKTLYQ